VLSVMVWDAVVAVAVLSSSVLHDCIKNKVLIINVIKNIFFIMPLIIL
jgi:hypothetical protein